MKHQTLLSLLFTTAVSGCSQTQADFYFEQQDDIMREMIHRKVGSSELMPRDDAEGHVDLIIKSSEYPDTSFSYHTDPGRNYCNEFRIITGRMTPQDYLIISYGKIDYPSSQPMYFTSDFLLTDRKPETLLNIPDQLPGTPALTAPYKIKEMRFEKCFFRPAHIQVQ